MATKSRERILAAAEDLMRTKGLARLTTKDIAKAAGLSEGTLFNHFARKDDLVMAVIVEKVPAFLGTIAEAGDKSVKENLIEIACGTMAFYRSVLPVILTLFADTELVARHQSAVRERQGGPQHMIHAVARYIEGEQELGRINPGMVPAHAAFSLTAPCFQWVFSGLSTGMEIFPGSSPEQFAHDLVETLWIGMEPPGSTVAKPAKAAPKKRA